MAGDNQDPISLMPDVFLNEDDIQLFDRVFDRVAMESRWSSRDVARAMARLLHYIIGDTSRVR